MPNYPLTPVTGYTFHHQTVYAKLSCGHELPVDVDRAGMPLQRPKRRGCYLCARNAAPGEQVIRSRAPGKPVSHTGRPPSAWWMPGRRNGQA